VDLPIALPFQYFPDMWLILKKFAKKVENYPQNGFICSTFKKKSNTNLCFPKTKQNSMMHVD